MLRSGISSPWPSDNGIIHSPHPNDDYKIHDPGKTVLSVKLFQHGIYVNFTSGKTVFQIILTAHECTNCQVDISQLIQSFMTIEISLVRALRKWKLQIKNDIQSIVNRFSSYESCFFVFNDLNDMLLA